MLNIILIIQYLQHTLRLMVGHKDISPEHTRAQILEAAQLRFSKYGYGKTTMAEIAKDCNMSAANLYRFFENKHDIGANLSCQCLENQLIILNQIVAQNTRSAAARLEEFVLTLLRSIHQQWSDNPHMDEMVNSICLERREIVEQHIQKKQELITSIIKEGNRLGEFDVSDPDRTAEAVFASFTLFVVPLMMSLFPLAELERKAHEVVHLILMGLNKR